MPRVPVLNSPQVATAPLPQVRESLAADPLAIAATGVGMVAQVLERERLEALDVRINAAEVRARDLRTRILNDPRSGVLSRRGEGAFGVQAEADAEWAKGVSAIEAELGDEDAREQFRLRADALRGELQGAVMRHEATQREAVDDATTKALLDDSLAAIGVDDAEADVHTERAAQVLAGRLERQGMPEEVRELRVAELRSAARLRQIQAQSAVNADRAMTTLERTKDQMNAKDRLAAEEMVQDASLKQTAQRHEDRILAAHPDDEAAALREARSITDPTTRDAVVQRVEARYAQQRRVQNASDQSQLEAMMASVEQRGDLSGLTPAMMSTARRRGWVEDLQSRAQQVRNGNPPVSDMNALETIYAAQADGTLKDIVPLTYRARLNDRDYRMLLEAVQAAKTGGDGSQNPAVTQEMVDRYTFAGARRLGLVAVDAPANLRGEHKTNFDQLRMAVAFQVDREREQKGANLLPSELEVAVNNALYARAMANLPARDAVPTGRPLMPTPNAPVRNVPAKAPWMRTRADREARAQQLVRAGWSEADAIAQTLRDIP